MSDELRAEILLFLEQKHIEDGGSVAHDDEAIVEALRGRRDTQEVLRHLDILESRELVRIHKTSGPSYAVQMTAKGLDVAERLRAELSNSRQAQAPMGFQVTPTDSRGFATSCSIRGKTVIIERGGHKRYDLLLSECDSPEKILSWVAHLGEKNWMTAKVLRDFVLSAAGHHGIDLPRN